MRKWLYSKRRQKSSRVVVVFPACLCLFQSFYNAEKFRFTAEFIELRRRGLDVFINRIALHPQLRQSEDLKYFLQANEEVQWPSQHFRKTTFSRYLSTMLLITFYI